METAKSAEKRWNIAPSSVTKLAVTSKMSTSFRLENYPDNTRYPQSPRDLIDKYWSMDKDESESPFRLEDSLLFHLLEALFVGYWDGVEGSERKLLKWVPHSYGE